MARGDDNKAIVKHFKAEGVVIAHQQLKFLRQANNGLIEKLQVKVAEKHLSTATNILDKSRKLIDKRLDHLAEVEDKRQSAWQRLQAGEITGQEYIEDTKGLPEVALTELNTVSREAFNQSQVEAGKPTSISANPQDAKLQLETLVRAIESGDEVKLQQIVFSKGGIIDVT